MVGTRRQSLAEEMKLMLQRRRYLLFFVVLGIVLSVLLLGTETQAGGSNAQSLTQGLATVTFLDVGQGDSIWLHTPDGLNYLVDGGTTTNGTTMAIRRCSTTLLGNRLTVIAIRQGAHRIGHSA